VNLYLPLLTESLRSRIRMRPYSAQASSRNRVAKVAYSEIITLLMDKASLLFQGLQYRGVRYCPIMAARCPHVLSCRQPETNSLLARC